MVDLSDVARNAESLRGKPSEEKSSLSRLSGLVLGMLCAASDDVDKNNGNDYRVSCDGDYKYSDDCHDNDHDHLGLPLRSQVNFLL